MFVGSVRWSRLSTVKEIRVVTALAKLHEYVLKSHLFQLSSTVNYIDIPHEDLGIHLTLHLTESDVDFNFLLGLKPFLYFSFQTTKKERPKNGMKTLNKSVVTKTIVGVEPLVEILLLKRKFTDCGRNRRNENVTSELLKMSGKRKLSKAQSSCKLF